MDRRALLFSLAVAAASVLIFGLVPAIQAVRADLNALMKAGDSVAPGRRRRWGRAILVGGQVTVSVVLLVIAMFMYREFRGQLADGPGYRTDHLVMLTLDPRLVRYSETQSKQFFNDVAERARRVPGVLSATMTTTIPMWNEGIQASTIAPEGYQFPAGTESVTVVSSMVDERYFDTIGIPILKGRQFRETDDQTAPRVAIVNQHLADHYWPNQDPLGKRILLPETPGRPWVEPFVPRAPVKYLFIAEPPSDFIYLARRQEEPQRTVLLAGRPASRRVSSAAARGGSQPRSEHADLKRAHDGGALSDARDEHLQCADHTGGKHGCDGAGPGHRWPLRAGRLRGQPAHARNRHPHGDRRQPHGGAAVGAAPGPRPRCGLASAWSRRRRRGPLLNAVLTERTAVIS